MVKTLPLAGESSHQDANQVYSLVGVQGTLGTNDAAGTAKTVALGANPDTGALYVQDLSGATGTTNITGTVVVSNLGNGSVTNVESGRLAVNLMAGQAAIQGGSGVVSTNTTRVTLATDVPLPALNNGSVNILTGTIQSSGTSTGMGVLSNLTNGSINILTGTVTAVTTVATVSNLTNGSVNLLTGTVTSVTNLAGGTVQLNRIPTVTQGVNGVHGTTGVTVVGTLAGGTGSGAGTEIFVTSLSLSIPSTAGSQDVSIGFGTSAGTFHAGTGRLIRGNFPAGGGITKSFDPPINSGTNAQVGYFQAGAGTVEIDITFFTAPSTI